MDNAFHHVPVLFDEVMEWMAPRPDGVYLDGTLGGGGHSEGILRLSGGTADACGDHRIAMSAAMAACGCEGPVTVLGSECVAKSYPAFWEDFASLREDAV